MDKFEEIIMQREKDQREKGKMVIMLAVICLLIGAAMAKILGASELSGYLIITEAIIAFVFCGLAVDLLKGRD